ncbi:hypothetical protein DR80_2018 [Francisella tularensis]|uniref:Uncharacterized protein n=1 Tax=Francisella tularensis TaxID=263 RepID=A0AAW3D596_FRATU|nr:hypothetical protein DR87_2004 [Francisella tularensis]KFJ60304.1 hypothetical protein DR80_2018 [Francisella tularensis]KFJ68805.1 hypothetical protein DR84_2001 [Francisella tularensis]
MLPFRYGFIICVSVPEEVTLRINSGNLKATKNACKAAPLPKKLANNKSLTKPRSFDKNKKIETIKLFEKNFCIV